MNDTLSCARCGHGWGLVITRQSYGDGAFEAYECEDCGATGSLTHDGVTNRTTLSGCLR